MQIPSTTSSGSFGPLSLYINPYLGRLMRFVVPVFRFWSGKREVLPIDTTSVMQLFGATLQSLFV
jgi:hypothetical protein